MRSLRSQQDPECGIVTTGLPGQIEGLNLDPSAPTLPVQRTGRESISRFLRSETGNGWLTISPPLLYAMLLLIGLIRLRVISPLRKMMGALQQSDTLEEALNVTLDESARNEVGELASWLNQRSRLLAEIAQQAQAVNTQLVLEVGERKSAVQNLAATRDRAEMTLKCIADGVITTDQHGKVDYMNPVAETLTGRSNQEVKGWAISRILMLLNENGTPYDEDIVSKVLAGGQRLRLADMSLKDATGSRVKVALTVAPVRGHASSILGTVVAINDPTAARRAMARPSPVPPNFRVVDASTWLKGLKSRSSLSSGIPIPESRTPNFSR